MNPEIIDTKGAYETEGSCLSLTGCRPAQRFRTIRVRYRGPSFEEHVETFEGFCAQIVQHEIDHGNGVVI